MPDRLQLTVPQLPKSEGTFAVSSIPRVRVLAPLVKMLMPVCVTVGSSTLPLATIACVTIAKLVAPPLP
ncbi:hypothetical protein D9M73_143750 [compost metagenome]